MKSQTAQEAQLDSDLAQPRSPGVVELTWLFEVNLGTKASARYGLHTMASQWPGSKHLSLPAQWMEWHPRAPVLLAGTADGNTWMWKVPNGDCKTFQGPNCPATCGQVLPDGKWLP